jgi:hypothetical protein
MPPTAEASSSMIVPVAKVSAPSPVGIDPSLLTADCSVSVNCSFGSTSVSPLTAIVTVAEPAPAGIVPLNASGKAGAPAKSAELASAEVSWSPKSTSPVVPPVRSTVNVKLVCPALPSGWLAA